MHPKCLCGNNRYEVKNYHRKDLDFQVLKCDKCGLCRTWPVPLTEAETADFYKIQDDYKTRDAEADLWKRFADRLLGIIDKHKSGKKNIRSRV